MATDFFKIVRDTVKHWYIPLIAGIIFVITGIYTVSQPLDSYLALSVIFSISFLLTGVMEIYFAIANRQQVDNWGWNLAMGILDFIVGMILLSNPALSMATLPLFVGFIILFRSISAISYGIDLRHYAIKSWGWVVFYGIIGVILALAMIFNPVFGGINIVVWTAIAFIITGLYSIQLSLALRRIKKLPHELKEKYETLKREVQQSS